MNIKGEHYNRKSFITAANNTAGSFDDDMHFSNEDSSLFVRIGNHIAGQRDLDEVMNDPDLEKTRQAVDAMISDYNKNLSVNKNNQKFIIDSLAEGEEEKKIKKDISDIKLEIGKSNINDISKEWVEEWHRRKQGKTGTESKSEEARNFITSSLQSGQDDRKLKSEEGNEARKGTVRKMIIRYASLSAAAVIGIFIIINTLLPSSDPGKLFDTYYQPFDAVSPVTRGMNTSQEGTYTSAVVNYRNGNYIAAASVFSSVLVKDPTSPSVRFFLGLTDIALNEYDQAIPLLEDVVASESDYGKEAQWYLGLAYLKNGNKQKAAEYFEQLSANKGFYQDRSEKILRRLK